MDDDRIDMEDIEHQGEDENVITIENNPNKKEEEERIKEMLMEAMATHDLLANNFVEVHLKKMAILPSWIHQIPGQIVANDSNLICYVTYSLL